jgi:predicted nucleic acid-binding protein
MLFGNHTFDKTMDEHLRDVAALASDSLTLVFLDTNILAYLYKLHENARLEFFAWSDSIANGNRLVVPAWAASEYLSRVTSKSLDSFTPKGKESSQAKKAMFSLYETAGLFVDDALLSKLNYLGSRDEYLTAFKDAITALEPFFRAFSFDFPPGVIHQQVVEHLSAAILDSDLAELCTRASQEGNARFEHRIPPGFRDGAKDANRFGDLIIWFEILGKAAASSVDFPKVLFITNDEKSDWVYAPTQRIEIVRGSRKPVPNSNPEIKLADPRLVSEFQRKTRHSNLMICSLATLVEGLSKVDATRFRQLATAIQINIQEAVTTPPSEAQPEAVESEIPTAPPAPVDEPAHPEEVTVEDPQEASTAEPAVPVESLLNYIPEALQDSQYQSDAPSDINAIIQALKSYNWYTQNPAITSIRAIRQEDFTPSSWFVLGRNIYQAACGNSQKAMEFMAALETQLAQFPNTTAQHVLAGMLFEIYFDSEGQFRKKAKFAYANKPLALATHDSYELARKFILFHLYQHRQRLKFLPGDHDPMTLRIVSNIVVESDEDSSRHPTHALHSVTLNGVELMRDLTDKADVAYARLLAQSKMRWDTLTEVVSEELAIPKWALTNHFEPPTRPDSQFVVPEGRELHPKLALETGSTTA